MRGPRSSLSCKRERHERSIRDHTDSTQELQTHLDETKSTSLPTFTSVLQRLQWSHLEACQTLRTSLCCHSAAFDSNGSATPLCITTSHSGLARAFANNRHRQHQHSYCCQMALAIALVLLGSLFHVAHGGSDTVWVRNCRAGSSSRTQCFRLLLTRCCMLLVCR